ncbi:MAG: hypothetical protein ACO23H_20205 [Alphaproteobacteria bacterium]
MKEKVERHLHSKMEPSRVCSEDGRLTAMLSAENRKLYPDHPKGKPFKVVYFYSGHYTCDFYYASIEEAHQSMRKYVNSDN